MAINNNDPVTRLMVPLDRHFSAMSAGIGQRCQGEGGCPPPEIDAAAPENPRKYFKDELRRIKAISHQFNVMLKYVLHLAARFLPGATSLRPFLHRLRGVRINGSVWIGEDVHLESAYPEAIELNDECGINLRSVLVAHWRGKGRIVVEKKARIGACCLITASPGETIVIGEGAMVAAGSVVTRSVAPYTLVAGVPAKPIARLTVPPVQGIPYSEFRAGIMWFKPRNPPEK